MPGGYAEFMLKFQRLERLDAPVVRERPIQCSPAPEGRLELDNRRETDRLNRKVSVRYRIAGESPESSFTLNLSPTGARVVLKGARPSYRNEMTLELGHQVNLRARTVWEEPLPGGHCRVAGLTFESMQPSQRNALHRLLNALAS